MDANTIINELLYKGLIPAGVHQKLTETDCPKQQNELLHACLLKTCTNEALMRACFMITSVQGNPKMSALGKDMQRRLESGVCVCLSLFLFVCVCVSCILLYSVTELLYTEFVQCCVQYVYDLRLTFDCIR